MNQLAKYAYIHITYASHSHHVFLFLIYHMHSRSRNIGPPSKVHHTRLRSRMENEERAILESRYQSELEAVRNEVSRMTNLLEQLLRAKNGEGTSTQPPIGALSAHSPGVSQNLGADSVTGQHFAPAVPIQPPQTHITVDLTADGPSDNRSTGFMNDDKISALEERLKIGRAHV